jgi:hypothetical protein
MCRLRARLCEYVPDSFSSDATLDSDVSIAAMRLSNPRLSSKRHYCIPTLKPILKRHTPPAYSLTIRDQWLSCICQNPPTNPEAP